MDGLLILDSKSGRLLFSRMWTPNFGLSSPEERNDPSVLAKYDKMYLSGVLFALFINAQDLSAGNEVAFSSSSSSPSSSLVSDNQA